VWPNAEVTDPLVVYLGDLNRERAGGDMNAAALQRLAAYLKRLGLYEPRHSAHSRSRDAAGACRWRTMPQRTSTASRLCVSVKRCDVKEEWIDRRRDDGDVVDTQEKSAIEVAVPLIANAVGEVGKVGGVVG
jgi:hypothetical protein